MFDFNYYGTDVDRESYSKDLPDLCHKCGRCCKSATTYAPYEELQEMVANGEQDAIDFLEIFQPYESVEAARAVIPDQVEQVMKEAEIAPDLDPEKVTFYHCRFVTPEGLCGIYERRPRCCVDAPTNGWSVMPPGCGFEGWQFLERERQKRSIRELKTSLHILRSLSPDGKTHPLRPETSLDEMAEAIEEKIKPWKRYGADYW